MLKKIRRRIIKAFMDILILLESRNRPISAYDVIALFHKEFHVLMSSGIVYSTLYSLERDGLIQGNWARRKRGARVYTLTEKGEKTIQAFLNVNEKIQVFIANLLRNPSE